VKRILAIACVLIAASVLVVFATGADGGNGGAYKVRAIFMNAFSVIPGEDVKIAGVKVGKVDSMDVTADHKAAVVLRIDNAGFKDFRRDAECSIRPQSLIGEKFVECTPTQPRPEGAQPAPKLERIEKGPGKGQYLLPVTQTSKPVDLDLVNNTLRLPYRERLAIILNELGTGLAGRGQDLRQAIRNADPALKETDKVLRILAQQNEVLRDLAVEGDRVLAPLAARRREVADFVVKAGDVSQATADRRADLQATFARLPRFLAELRPTMVRLARFSDEASPVVEDLGVEAPNLSRFAKELGPFSQASSAGAHGAGACAAATRGRRTSPSSAPRGPSSWSAAPRAGGAPAACGSARGRGRFGGCGRRGAACATG